MTHIINEKVIMPLGFDLIIELARLESAPIMNVKCEPKRLSQYMQASPEHRWMGRGRFPLAIADQSMEVINTARS